MKLANSTVYNSINSLAKLSNCDMPIKIAYKIKKNFDVLKKQADFINERRNELINKYGKDGKIEQTDTKAVEKFVNDFNEMLAIEEDLEVTPIDVDSLEGIMLSVNDLDNLAFMLCSH